jgi:hypothetical protein
VNVVVRNECFFFVWQYNMESVWIHVTCACCLLLGNKAFLASPMACGGGESCEHISKGVFPEQCDFSPIRTFHDYAEPYDLCCVSSSCTLTFNPALWGRLQGTFSSWKWTTRRIAPNAGQMSLCGDLSRILPAPGGVALGWPGNLACIRHRTHLLKCEDAASCGHLECRVH